MTTIHRSPSESFPETVTWLCDLLGVDRRMATFLVWDVCIKVGTDRHHWIDTDRAHRFISSQPGTAPSLLSRTPTGDTEKNSP